jgi:hypothetical protein
MLKLCWPRDLDPLVAHAPGARADNSGNLYFCSPEFFWHPDALTGKVKGDQASVGG